MTSPRSTPAQVAAHKAGDLEHTAHPAGSSACGKASFLGPSVDLNLFQAFQLSFFMLHSGSQSGLRGGFCLFVFSGFGGLVLFCCFAAFIAYSGREGLSESARFQGPPEAISCCLPSCLNSFCAGWTISIFYETTVAQP